MTDRQVTVGVLQLVTHPALVLGKWDLLEEPYWPADRKLNLASLGSTLEELRRIRADIRGRYIAWIERRLLAVVDSLSASPPDVLVVPECSIPAELLPVLKARAKAFGMTIFAGTHTPCGETEALYLKAGVGKKQAAESRSSTTAVLPVLRAGKPTLLHNKTVPAVFEQLDHRQVPTGPVAVELVPVHLKHMEIRVATLVCAEALRLLNNSIGKPPPLAARLAKALPFRRA